MMAEDPKLQALLREIEDRYMPEQGWCDEDNCETCARAEEQVRAAIDAARTAYHMQNREGPGKDLATQRRIFEQGYERGHGEALNQAHSWARQSALRARMEAKNEWYRKGLRDGRKATPNPPAAKAVDEKALTKKFVDGALEECHIIGESNPQMKPAANAIGHRIKKRFR
jgi:hypothetical protein